MNGTALVDGAAIGSFYSYKFWGLNPSNGTPMFDDYNDRKHLLEYKTLEETVLMTMEKSDNVIRFLVVISRIISRTKIFLCR